MEFGDAEARVQALRERGLSLDESSRLGAWLRLLDQWNARVNLTGLRSLDLLLHHLVDPVLAIRDLPESGSLLDIGSGNGSPGLIWAALRPDLRVTLLEPRLKRWAFLRDAVRAIGRPDTRVLRDRHDEYEGPGAETVSVRALALPLDEISRLILPRGRLVVLGAPPTLGVHWQADAQPWPGVHVLRCRVDSSR